MKPICIYLLAIFFFGFHSTSSNAQLIQQYGFAGAAGTEITLPPNGQPTNGSLTSIRRGSGITPPTGTAANAFGATGFTMATLLDSADYFEFGIKANTSFVLNLDSVVVTERRSNTGIRKFAVRSSLDNFTADLSTFNLPDDASFRSNQRTNLGTAFKNVGASTLVRFRYYGYAAEAETGTWRLDSIRIYGTISTAGPQNPAIGFQSAAAMVTEGDSVTIQINATSATTQTFSIVQKSGSVSVADFSTNAPFLNTQFPVGSTVTSKRIKAIADGVTEGNELAVFVLRTGSSTLSIGGDSLFTLTIKDPSGPVTEPYPFTRSVSQIRGLNSNGGADSVGHNVRLYGTVYGLNQRLTTSGGGYQMYLRDATGGIGIFKTTPVNGITTLNEGDSVKIMGKIEVFRGLSQINPDSMVVLATGRSIKSPTVALKASETLEADLIRLNGVQLVDPTKWTTGVGTTGFTVKVYKDLDTTDVRIDNDCPLYSQAAPTGTFDLIGMGSQFTTSTTAPWTGGYQMIPRRINDLVLASTTPTCNFDQATQSFQENSDSIRITIKIKPTPTVSHRVWVTIKSGTAIGGTDYIPTIVPTVNEFFNAGDTSAVYKLKLLDDFVQDGNKSIVLKLSVGQGSATANALVGPDSIMTVTILDNESSVQTGPPFTRTIGQVRGTNANGGADSVGRNVRLYGTVYGLNQRLTTSGGGYQMYLRDATGGIGIFKTTPVNGITTLNEGDSVKIMGKIEVFRGLSQINPDSMVVLATGRSIKSPTVALKASETLEADLIRLNGVQLVDPTKWTTGVGTTGFTVKVYKDLDTTDVRIDNDCPLYSQAAPTGTFDLIGMGSQFTTSTTAPWNGGYQMIPRKLTDLITAPTANPEYTFTFPNVNVTEAAASVLVTVNGSLAPSSNVVLDVVLKGGTASVGSDYTAISITTITFPAGSSNAQTFSINPIDDAIQEPTETIVLAIRPHAGSTEFTIGADSIFTLSLGDNDGPVVVEPYPFTRTIATVRGTNANGGADSVGRNVRLYGTVYGLNQRLTTSGGGYQMYLRDATGGIGIFKTTPVNGITTLNEGDSVKIMGKIEVFRGLSQINPDSMVVLATGRSIKSPTVALKASETLEADLIRLNGVQLVDPTKWTTGVGTTGFTVKVYKDLDTTDVRIDNDCPLYSQAAPTGTFDIIGMGSQFTTSTTAPWNGGYQLIPRRVSDVITGTPTTLTFGFSTASKNVMESAGTVSVNVSPSFAPVSDVTLEVHVKGGTASFTSDYTPPALLLTFPAGSTAPKAVTLTVTDDSEVESSENVILVIRPQTPSASFAIGTDSLFTLTITDNDGAVTEPYPFTRTIGQVRGTNANGGADSVGRNVRIYGTIYGVNQRLTAATGGYQMFVRDATGGIGIFKNAPINGITALNEGDSVKLMGKIEVFRGLSQINPDSMKVIATGRPLKTPTVVTSLDEPKEADLLRFNNVTLVSPAAWTTGVGASGFTVQITDGTTTTDVRIDNDCPLYNQPAPTGPFDLIGMGGQFTASTTAPWAGGYQLIPRKLADLLPNTEVNPLCNCVLNLKAYPNPGSSQLVLETKAKTNFTYQIFNGLGKVVWEKRAPESTESISTGLWSPGVYTIRVQETGHVVRWVKQ